MKTVTVKAGKGYEVRIGRGLLPEIGRQIGGIAGVKRVMIVSDDNVYPLYGETVRSSLLKAGYETETFVFPHGEASKNLTVYGELLGRLCDAGLTRDDLLVALGGGVVGDLAGFAAATYRRGIPFVQVPTTLLAAVDSSVGGKTAVDLPNGKNQVGAFYQPALVLCDPDTLGTLPEVEYRNGCAEIIKYGVLDGAELFGKLSDRPVREQYEDIIERCVAIKRDYVEADEFDRGLRMLLNLGHTIGHAVEACSDFEIPHGQGVSIGMAAIVRASVSNGLCSAETAQNVIALLTKYGLPTEIPYGVKELAAAAGSDKKNTGASMRLVIPEAIGNCTVHTIPASDFPEWLRKGGANE